MTDPEFTSKQMAEQFRDVAEEFWDFTQDKWNEVDHAVLLESALLGNLHANLAVVERLDTLIETLRGDHG